MDLPISSIAYEQVTKEGSSRTDSPMYSMLTETIELENVDKADYALFYHFPSLC